MGTRGLFLPLCMLELRRNSREIVGGNSAPSASPHLFYNESAKCKSLIMSNSLGPHGLHSPRNSPGQNTGVCSLSLLQGIFPTQGLNPGLPNCKQILYQLSYQGSQNYFPHSQRRSYINCNFNILLCICSFYTFQCLGGTHSLNYEVKRLPTMQRPGFNPWVRKISWRRKWQPTPVFLPEKSHGGRAW